MTSSGERLPVVIYSIMSSLLTISSAWIRPLRARSLCTLCGLRYEAGMGRAQVE